MTRARLTFLAWAIAVGMAMPLPAFAECIDQRIGQIYLPMNLNAPRHPMS